MASAKLTPDLIKKAKEELNENPETRTNDIQQLRNMVLADSALTSITDDAFLIRFLRARKFDCKAAFELLQRYYRHQQDYAGLYVDFRPSTMRNGFEDSGQPMLLPDKDQLGRSVFVWHLGKWNPDACPLDDFYRCFAISVEKAIEDESTQINGFVIIDDLDGIGTIHAKNLMPQAVYKFLMFVDTFPFELKEFHFTRQSAIFDAILTLVKPFMSDKLKNALILHGWNLESLHKYVTPDILPEELGGRKPPMNNSDYYKSLLARDENFLPITQGGYQSIQKLGGPSSDKNVVGSSYKKLDCD